MIVSEQEWREGEDFELKTKTVVRRDEIK